MSPRAWQLFEWSVKAAVIGAFALIIVSITCNTPSGGDITRHVVSGLCGLVAGTISFKGGR